MAHSFDPGLDNLNMRARTTVSLLTTNVNAGRCLKSIPGFPLDLTLSKVLGQSLHLRFS